MRKFSIKTCWLISILLFLVHTHILAAPISTQSQSTTVNHNHATQPFIDINTYIEQNWQKLESSIFACAAYNDTKINAKRILYLPHHMPISAQILALQKRCHIEIKRLAKPINKIGDIKTNEVYPHGLLYLPYSYIVPGGRFNEMYGWDSYFIVRGLLHSGHVRLAKNILENYFFEIEHYGTILNANRSYHLSRSQPPFLTATIFAIYPQLKMTAQEKIRWLNRAYHYAKKDYLQWTKPPFLAPGSKLSRYYDPEDERLIETKVYPAYYQNVYQFIAQHPVESVGYLEAQQTSPSLSKDFYRGERSLRASGFDLTNRFGAFGGRTHYYIPVCLNSLLYKTEKDLAQMAHYLAKKDEAIRWEYLASERQKIMNKYLYNNQLGLFLDYDFERKKQSTYYYATTFYPLWVGLATQKQAAAVVANLRLFEQAGGLSMSDQESGLQWDKPFGWAPIQLIAVEGLWQYGYQKEALGIAKKFNQTVKNNFVKTGCIYEKYNVITGATNTHFIGYKENAIGFGWTNATFLIFQDLLATRPK